MTAVDESVRTSSGTTLLGTVGLIMVPPLVFGGIVAAMWLSYFLIHTLGFLGAWAVCAAPLLIVRLAVKRGLGVCSERARRLIRAALSLPSAMLAKR